jgi:hypothetical protein
MRLRPINEWRDEPFSYSKIWLALSVWFGFASAPVLSYDVGGWQFSGLFVWLIVNVTFQKGAKVALWSILSRQLRQEIPYDRGEAAEGKGSIHSYKDLWRWFRR